MRAVIQRVIYASVEIDRKVKAAIGAGILVLIGFEDADNEEDIIWMSNKIIQLRIFNDQAGVMNCSLKDTNGELLLVSQFTLYASTRKGNRPSYLRSSNAQVAIPLYERTIRQLEQALGKKIATGEFGADMKVSLLNDGPVTILIDTKNKE